jgi:hypothetical protein
MVIVYRCVSYICNRIEYYLVLVVPSASPRHSTSPVPMGESVGRDGINATEPWRPSCTPMPVRGPTGNMDERKKRRHAAQSAAAGKTGDRRGAWLTMRCTPSVASRSSARPQARQHQAMKHDTRSCGTATTAVVQVLMTDNSSDWIRIQVIAVLRAQQGFLRVGCIGLFS